jgi:hypothetical protein
MGVGALTILGTFAPTRPEKEESGRPRPTSTITRKSSGRATLRREQRERLESGHRENRNTGRTVRPSTDVASTGLGGKKWRYACRSFGVYGLKEGVMWRVEYIWYIYRQRLVKHIPAAANRRATMKVLLQTTCFYVVRANESFEDKSVLKWNLGREDLRPEAEE